LRDRAKPGGKEVRYARRPLIGFAEAERAMVRDVLLTHLAHSSTD
jgi:hypothetical protein